TVIRFEISDSWDIQDFASFYNSIDVLYRHDYCVHELNSLLRYLQEFELIAYDKQPAIESYLYFIPNLIRTLINLDKFSFEFIQDSREVRFGLFAPFPFKPNDTFFDYQPLLVTRTQHSSPGFTDLLGISGLLKEIRELIQYYLPNREGKEKVELIRQQRISMQIDNYKKIGLSDTEIQKILLQEQKSIDITKKLISEGKILDAHLVDE
ncbi:MAG TPA: hypothetical protein VIJ75_02050, partial [Hanamia sp.]